MLLHYIRLIHLHSAWLHYRNRKHISRQYLCSSTSRSLCLLQLIFVCGISVSLLFNQKLWPQAPAGRIWPHFGCFFSSACFNQELGSFPKREMSNRIWVFGKNDMKTFLRGGPCWFVLLQLYAIRFRAHFVQSPLLPWLSTCKIFPLGCSLVHSA